MYSLFCSLSLVENEDYEPTNFHITVPGGSNISVIVCDEVNISIIDDFIVEGIQSFNLEITDTSLDEVTIEEPSALEIYIIDDDSK